MRLPAIVGCLVLVAVLPARAQERSLPEELAVTESIKLQDADELQTTLLTRYARFPDAKEFALVGAFEYGLTDRLQVECEVPYRFVNPDASKSVNGIGDIEIAARYGVRDYRTQSWALDVGLGVVLPTGDRDKELGEGRTSIEPRLTLSQCFGPVNAQLNLGWQRAVGGGGPESKDEFTYNVALVLPVRECYLVLEGNGTTVSSETQYYITPEIIWHPRRNVELMLAVPVGVTHASADYQIIAGITLEFGSVTGRAKDND